MNLITRCPACATSFRVVRDQLRISDGWVRCGRCSQVFDATLALREEPEGASVESLGRGERPERALASPPVTSATGAAHPATSGLVPSATIGGPANDVDQRQPHTPAANGDGSRSAAGAEGSLVPAEAAAPAAGPDIWLGRERPLPWLDSHTAGLPLRRSAPVATPMLKPAPASPGAPIAPGGVPNSPVPSFLKRASSEAPSSFHETPAGARLMASPLHADQIADRSADTFDPEDSRDDRPMNGEEVVDTVIGAYPDVDVDVKSDGDRESTMANEQAQEIRDATQDRRRAQERALADAEAEAQAWVAWNEATAAAASDSDGDSDAAPAPIALDPEAQPATKPVSSEAASAPNSAPEPEGAPERASAPAPAHSPAPAPAPAPAPWTAVAPGHERSRQRAGLRSRRSSNSNDEEDDGGRSANPWTRRRAKPVEAAAPAPTTAPAATGVGFVVGDAPGDSGAVIERAIEAQLNKALRRERMMSALRLREAAGQAMPTPAASGAAAAPPDARRADRRRHGEPGLVPDRPKGAAGRRVPRDRRVGEAAGPFSHSDAAAPSGFFELAAQASAQPARRRSRGSVAAVWLLSALAALALLTQVVRDQRDMLAAREPALQPALQRFCEYAGCQVAAPRDIAAIKLDGFSISEPGPDGWRRVNLTLRNDARYPVASPALELTLTDLDKRPVIRRALMPAEYGMTPQIPAGSERDNAFYFVLRGPDADRLPRMALTMQRFYP